MPDITISWVAAILGLVVAIVLILKKFNPVYSLFFGAIVGCLIGGASLSDTVAVLLNGTQSIMGTAIRVLAYPRHLVIFQSNFWQIRPFHILPGHRLSAVGAEIVSVPQ